MTLKDQAYYNSIYQDLLKDEDIDEAQAKRIIESLQEVDSWAPCYTAEEVRKSLYQLKKVWYATV